MKIKITAKIAAVLWLSLLVSCSKNQSEQKPPKPVKVKAVEMSSLNTGVRYSASIRPAAQVDVAFKVGGYIEAIAQQRDASGQWRHLQAGDVVRQGTVLARVRQSDYVAQVNQARSTSPSLAVQAANHVTRYVTILQARMCGGRPGRPARWSYLPG